MFNCEKCKIKSKPNKKFVELKNTWKNGKMKIKYIWSEDGKDNYKNWFNKFMQKHLSGSKNTRKSVEAARDCITRASNASTWSCDDGSRPFFWHWGR
jgi:hypothetical protein